jgi:hypothetical protein
MAGSVVWTSSEPEPDLILAQGSKFSVKKTKQNWTTAAL